MKYFVGATMDQIVHSASTQLLNMSQGSIPGPIIQLSLPHNCWFRDSIATRMYEICELVRDRLPCEKIETAVKTLDRSTNDGAYASIGLCDDREKISLFSGGIEGATNLTFSVQQNALHLYVSFGRFNLLSNKMYIWCFLLGIIAGILGLRAGYVRVYPVDVYADPKQVDALRKIAGEKPKKTKSYQPGTFTDRFDSWTQFTNTLDVFWGWIEEEKDFIIDQWQNLLKNYPQTTSTLTTLILDKYYDQSPEINKHLETAKIDLHPEITNQIETLSK